MLLEALIAAAVVIAASIGLRIAKSDESLTVRLEFITDKGKIPFCTKKYSTWEEFDFAQDQLALIAIDFEKNVHFRNLHITGISLIEVSSGKDFFYTQLKKDP